MRVIRAFSREQYEQGRFDATSSRLRQVMLRMNVLEGIVHPVYEVLAASLVLIILLVAVPNARTVPSCLCIRALPDSTSCERV
jgi:subfamily B ATP-binding cassette protein MsbA